MITEFHTLLYFYLFAEVWCMLPSFPRPHNQYHNYLKIVKKIKTLLLIGHILPLPIVYIIWRLGILSLE